MNLSNSFFHLREQLGILSKEGRLISIDLDMAVHMISGALNELSLFWAEKEEKLSPSCAWIIKHASRTKNKAEK